MYGDKASELIRSLTRNTNDLMPPYETELMEQIKQENDEIYEAIIRIINDGPSTSSGQERVLSEDEKRLIGVRYTAIDWSKRCIIAYHIARLNKLKQFRWDYGNTLPEEIKNNISPRELKWFEQYNKNLFRYMNDLAQGDIDLTLYVKPPKRLYVEVKCVKDLGQFDLEDGQQVIFKKDSLHLLPLSQCEKLINQGILEQVKPLEIRLASKKS